MWQYCPRTCGLCGDGGGGCPPPDSVINGQVLGDQYQVGATIHFQCDAGYMIEGPSSRICLSSGEWNDNRNPLCKRIGNDILSVKSLVIYHYFCVNS